MSLRWLRTPAGGMDLARADLKQQLFIALHAPRIYQGRFQLLTQCQLCGGVFTPGLFMPALHELVLERDDVQSAVPEVQYAVLHTPLNLTLLCNEPCNIKLAKDTMLRDYLLGRQVTRYGLAEICNWIRSLALEAPAPYLYRVETAAAHWQVARDETELDFTQRRQAQLDLVRERLASYGRPPLF